METDQRLLRDFLGPDEIFHVARCRVSSENTSAHTHDFAEIFWVEQGESRHHVDGAAQAIGEGDVVLVRPWDRHWYEPASNLRFVNLAFEANEIGFLRDRYFAHVDDFYGWEADAPLLVSHGPLARWIGYRTEQLLRGARGRSELDLFLIEFFALLYADGGPHASAPPWYDALVDLLASPQTLRGSVDSLAAEIGFSPEHLARQVRGRLGVTPIELLTRARMDYARRLLEHSDLPILDVCLECGYASLSHFYRVFRDRCGTTPRRFRASAQRAGADLVL